MEIKVPGENELQDTSCLPASQKVYELEYPIRYVLKHKVFLRILSFLGTTSRNGHSKLERIRIEIPEPLGCSVWFLMIYRALIKSDIVLSNHLLTVEL